MCHNSLDNDLADTNTPFVLIPAPKLCFPRDYTSLSFLSLFSCSAYSSTFSFVLYVLQPSLSLLLCCSSNNVLFTLFGVKLSFCWTVPSFLPYFNLLLLNPASLYEISALNSFYYLSVVYVCIIYSANIFVNTFFKIFLYFFIIKSFALYFLCILHLYFKLYIHFTQHS